MDKLQILIADCGNGIALLLKNALGEAQFESVLVCREGVDIHYLRQVQPDMLILGIHFSARDSWGFIRILREDEEFVELPIIVVSQHSSEAENLLAFELGVDEYISQPLNSSEFVARVRVLFRRSTKKAHKVDEVLVVGDLLLDAGRHEVSKKGKSVDLTPIEFNTLQELMANPGYVFSRLTLIEKVTSNSSQTIERTLDSHIKNLRRKLGDDPKNPHYIETVYGIGYRMSDPV